MDIRQDPSSERRMIVTVDNFEEHYRVVRQELVLPAISLKADRILREINHTKDPGFYPHDIAVPTRWLGGLAVIPTEEQS